MSEEVKSLLQGNVAILPTEGYVNETIAEAIAVECERLLEEGIKNFILNMTQSRMINSVGIAIVVEIIEKATQEGGSLVFCGVSPTIAKTFQIMGLLQLSAIFESEEDALQAMPG